MPGQWQREAAAAPARSSASSAGAVVSEATSGTAAAAEDVGAADETDGLGEGDFFFTGAFDDDGAPLTAPPPDNRTDVVCVFSGDNVMPESVAVRPYTSEILILKGPDPAPPSMIQLL